MDFKLTYRQFSERSILVEWPQEISEFILKDVLLFKKSILNLDIKLILQINSAYNSLLIIYKYAIEDVYDEILTLRSCYLDRKIVTNLRNQLFKIPVCYDEEFGLDLVEISEEKKMPISEIIQLHSQPLYTVFFIGFLPGFLYLGGLDERLHFPRKKSPRLQIKKGAIAIGGEQTGMYPNASPGGWNIVGNSPLELFIKDQKEPCFAKSGDKIQFRSISREEFNSITLQIKEGNYTIESEVLDD